MVGPAPSLGGCRVTNFPHHQEADPVAGRALGWGRWQRLSSPTGSRGRTRRSVQEALARLLPAAGRAPQVPLLQAVDLPALLGVTTRLPGGDPEETRADARLHSAPPSPAHLPRPLPTHAPWAGTKLGGQGWHTGPDRGGLWLQADGGQAALKGDAAVSSPRSRAP